MISIFRPRIPPLAFAWSTASRAPFRMSWPASALPPDNGTGTPSLIGPPCAPPAGARSASNVTRSMPGARVRIPAPPISRCRGTSTVLSRRASDVAGGPTSGKFTVNSQARVTPGPMAVSCPAGRPKQEHERQAREHPDAHEREHVLKGDDRRLLVEHPTEHRDGLHVGRPRVAPADHTASIAPPGRARA